MPRADTGQVTTTWYEDENGQRVMKKTQDNQTKITSAKVTDAKKQVLMYALVFWDTQSFNLITMMKDVAAYLSEDEPRLRLPAFSTNTQLRNLFTDEERILLTIDVMIQVVQTTMQKLMKRSLTETAAMREIIGLLTSYLTKVQMDWKTVQRKVGVYARGNYAPSVITKYLAQTAKYSIKKQML